VSESNVPKRQTRRLTVWRRLALAACLACALALPFAADSAAAARDGGTRTLRVMSYNVHVGIGVDKRIDLARVAEVINRERPDLVGLQEIDCNVARTNRVDQIAELARLTGMQAAFAPNLEYQGGWYGVAVLSRLPLVATEHRLYQHLRETERRGYLRAEVEVGRRRPIFVTTHLDYQHRDNRFHETEQLLASVADLRAPVVIAGDFNDEPSGDSYRLMLTRFTDVWAGAGGQGEGLTYPADKPAKRIDYIFYRARGSLRLRTRRAWVVESLASDHRAVMAEIDFGTD